MRFRVLFIFGVVLIIVGPVPRMAATQAGAEVALSFAWPDGIRGTVTSTRSLQNSLRTSRIQSAARWTFTSERAGGARRIVTRDLVVSPIDEWLEEDELNAALVVTTYLPSMVATADGELLTLLDPGASRRSIAAAVEAAVPPSARAHAMWPTVEQSWATDESLHRWASTVWQMMVGPFAGSHLRIGETLEGESTSAAIASGIVIPQHTTLRLVGRVPCSERERRPRCVEIVVHTVHDTSALAAQLHAAGVREFDMHQDFQLVTEPRTLLPHRGQLRETRRFTTTVGNANEHGEEVVVSTWAFAYERDRGGPRTRQ